MDYREELLQSIVQSLIVKGYDPETINDIQNVLISKIGNYEISERCTEIMVVESHSTQLINYFIGTILTEGKSKRTAIAYRELIFRFYSDVNKPLTEVNVFDIRKWLSDMMQSVSPTTCENYRSYLASFYQFLNREDIIDKNPMAKIKPIKIKEKIKFPFDAEDLECMRNVCNLRERAILEILLSTGMRVSELCSLDINDVNFDSYEIYIKHGKGDKDRTVCFDKKASYYLKQYILNRKKESGIVFTSRSNERLSVAMVERSLRKIGKLSNVKNVHPHRCRVHFATEMYRKGMDLRTIQTLLGHSSIETTMGYIAHLTDRTKQEYNRIA